MAAEILIAAPQVPGRALLAAARSAGVAAEWFHSPSWRDPTLELPEAVRSLLPVRLVVVPDREEPATLEIVREAGAFVIALLLPLEPSDPRNMLARQRWVSRAADAVVVTAERRTALFRDRRGRPATAVPWPATDSDTAGFTAVLRALLSLA